MPQLGCLSQGAIRKRLSCRMVVVVNGRSVNRWFVEKGLDGRRGGGEMGRVGFGGFVVGGRLERKGEKGRRSPSEGGWGQQE